jgi:tetratricopeptide (TPR) repeat protein
MKKISNGACNFRYHVLFFGMIVILWSGNVLGQKGPTPESLVTKLLSVAHELVQRTHYLEALDLLEEARDTLDSSGADHPELYADTLYELARAKIKARLYQNFPAYYVKTALEDVQASNRIRERLDKSIPQELADGYYLEGFIQKKFFMRREQAKTNFLKALKIDPASVAARRELSELVSGQDKEEK